MAGKYCKLVAGEGFLEGESSLRAPRAALAEQEADVIVDRELALWDRTSWTASSTPSEVNLIALRIASAWYIEMQFAKASPDKVDEVAFPKMLRDEADARFADIKGRGWITGNDGEPIYPRNESGATKISPRCRR